MLGVLVVPSILFPPKRPGGPTGARADSTARLEPAAPESAAAAPLLIARPPERSELLASRSFAPADSGRAVQLVPPGQSWLVYAPTGESDTLALSDWSFSPSAAALHVGTDSATLTFSAERGGARVSIAYRFSSTEYHFGVRGRLEGFGASGATLLVGMGDGLRSVEADSLDDFRHYAIVTKAAKTQGTGFESLKPGERKILDGPFEWAGVKS